MRLPPPVPSVGVPGGCPGPAPAPSTAAEEEEEAAASDPRLRLPSSESTRGCEAFESSKRDEEAEELSSHWFRLSSASAAPSSAAVISFMRGCCGLDGVLPPLAALKKAGQSVSTQAEW